MANLLPSILSVKTDIRYPPTKSEQSVNQLTARLSISLLR